MGGSSARPEKSVMPITPISTEASEKLKSLNIFKSTKGCLAVSEWTRNTQSPAMTIPSSIQVSGEWNQSFSAPRSSSNCNAPTPKASMPKPKKSKRRFLISVWGMKSTSMATQTAPTGTLTKNTQRQSKVSVSQPPNDGPMIGATMMPMP